MGSIILKLRVIESRSASWRHRHIYSPSRPVSSSVDLHCFSKAPTTSAPLLLNTVASPTRCYSSQVEKFTASTTGPIFDYQDGFHSAESEGGTTLRTSQGRAPDCISGGISYLRDCYSVNLSEYNTRTPQLPEQSSLKTPLRIDKAIFGSVKLPHDEILDVRASIESRPKLVDIYEALGSGDCHEILSITMSYLLSGGSLRAIPDSTFSELLRQLGPAVYLGRMMDLFSEISRRSEVYDELRSPREDSLHEFGADFVANVKWLLERRVAEGHSLISSDFKHILLCARAVGDVQIAEDVWSMMNSAGIAPDVECYNHLFAARVWADSKNPARRHHLRKLPFYQKVRQQTYLPQGFGHRLGETGLKVQISEDFHEMVRQNMTGNEETFCLMMIAQAREGDMDGIQSILNRVWNIDVDALRKDTGQLKHTVKQLPQDSPFRPSKDLLMTIAHSFGICNDIPIALRLLDFVSRSYKVSIPPSVWGELLERTYVLSNRRASQKVESGEAEGQLPGSAVEGVWKTMVQEPYNIAPTMPMFNILVMSYIKLRRFRLIESSMHEALKVHQNTVHRYSMAVFNYRLARKSKASGPRLRALHRETAFTYLEMHRSRQYIKKWVRHFIHWGVRRLGMRQNPDFLTTHLPKFLFDWRAFAPRRVIYETPTGWVSFSSQVEEYNRALIRRRQYNLARRVNRDYILSTEVARELIDLENNHEPLEHDREDDAAILGEQELLKPSPVSHK